MSERHSITFVIPAYNVANTIGYTLRSVFHPLGRSGMDLENVEAIVVDDGSIDGAALSEIVTKFPRARLIVHDRNRGMCAARNSGIKASTCDVTAILDADDELVPNWPTIFTAVRKEWPRECPICFTSCRNPEGKPTVAQPNFNGVLTTVEFVSEKFSGEYMPLFDTHYIKSKRGYIDLGTRKSCGALSYLEFLQDHPFWISSHILRIYHDAQATSITAAWARPDRAYESLLCTQQLLRRFAPIYRQHAPSIYYGKYLRLAVYSRLAGKPGAWKAWGHGLYWSNLPEASGAFLVLLLGRSFCVLAVRFAKSVGLIKAYG